MITLTLATCVLLAAQQPVGARAEPQAFLVKDINTTPVIYSSNPQRFATIDGTAFFAADAPNGWSQFWKSDGTATGTELVKAVIVVGTPVRVDRTLFFVGQDAHGLELWKSDGTEAGTVLVDDLKPGPSSAFDTSDFTNALTAVGDALFFVADDGVHGRGLWKSDGTAAGTVRLTNQFATWLAAADDILLFAADERGYEYELWRSDGTVDGTVRVKDINAGARGSSPLAPTDVNGTVFFVADDGIHGRELWRTDGTETGTVLVSDINPGSGYSEPSSLTAVGSTLFFRAGDDGIHTGQLWRSDGTAAGTMLVAPGGMTNLGGLIAFGDTLLFAEDDGVSGLELWTSDGTPAGTARVADINPGPASAFPNPLTLVDGMVFFMADDGVHGAELWRSDGTADGTVLVRDVNVGRASAAPDFSGAMIALDDRVLLSADDGVHGFELWASDGTPAGTTLLQDIWPGPATAGSSPGSLTALGDRLVFTADDGETGTGLWSTNGTPAGTVRVPDVHVIDPASPQRPLTELDGRVLFAASDSAIGSELWSSDGTAAGSALVRDIVPGPFGSTPTGFTRVADAVFFAAHDDVHGRELWKSDGTESGTVLVKDIMPGAVGSSPMQLTRVGVLLFFTVGDGRDMELWVSDGSGAGTIRLRDVFYAANMTDVAGTLYFTTGTTLWTSDGTPAGTAEVADFHPASGQVTPNQLTAVGARLFFVAKPSGGSSVTLWTTDGEHLMALGGPDHFAFNQLTSAGGRLFFRAYDSDHGEELWTSDGTEAGTRLVRDINPGGASASPTALSAAPGRLLFRACDRDACRLWESDGTEEGTRPLADLTLEPSGGFVVAGSLAYFSAFDFAFGAELRAALLSSGGCTGDCNRDGVVTVSELVRMVGHALGATDRSCTVGGVDGAPVTVDVLVIAVNNALLGCRG